MVCRGGKDSEIADDGKLPKEKRSKPETERTSGGVHGHGNRDTAKRTSGHHGDASRRDDRHHRGDHSEAPHGAQDSREVKKTTRVPQVVADPPPVKKLAQQDHWLSSNLIVKMADRMYKKGRHYNTKVSDGSANHAKKIHYQFVHL